VMYLMILGNELNNRRVVRDTSTMVSISMVTGDEELKWANIGTKEYGCRQDEGEE